MENKGLTNPQDMQIQGLLDRYLRARVSGAIQEIQGEHLNEDLLAAFTEGNLNERESQPIVRHLVGCSFCREMTTELVKLDMAFAEEEIQVVAAENQPSKVSEVLNSILSRIFGVGDSAVFAHEEKVEDSEHQEHPEDKDKKE